MQDIYYKVAHRDQKELDSFATRYDDFDTSLIPDIFKDALNLEVIDWKQSKSWGSSHVVYFVTIKGKDKPLVLRSNLGFSEPEVVMLVEKLITEKVDELSVPTNKVLHVDVSRNKFPFDYQIQEELVGNDIEDHFKGKKEDYDKLSFDLGVMIAKYSKLTFEKFGLFNEEEVLRGKLIGTKETFYDYLITKLEDDLKYLVDAKTTKFKTSKKVLKIFEKHKDVTEIKKGSLVHHDLADHNIFFKGKEITGIFDWEACVIGDPALDLASAPTWRTHHSREKHLLKGYSSITKLPDNFKEKRDLYRLRTIIWKTVYCQRIRILTPERRKRLEDVLIPYRVIL